MPQMQNLYVYALNNPVIFTDPSGEVVPGIAAIALIGFLAGAGYNAYQQYQANGGLCDFDVMEMLSGGIGGAITAVGLTFGALWIAEMAGLGLQGAAMALYGAGIATPWVFSMFGMGIGATALAANAAAWLWTGNNYPTLVIDSSKMPNIADNIRNAQANGAPQVLTRTTNQALISANRQAACAGFCGTGSPDEYPFASTYEGGAGAFVKGVPLNEQFTQGGIISGFYTDNLILDGRKFRVLVK